LARDRFVLRYRGEGAAPDADVARVRGLPGTVVIDVTDRMLLVESDLRSLGELVDGLADWVMAPEQSYAVPDTRKKIEGPPE
jgi:hypothetical protein